MSRQILQCQDLGIAFSHKTCFMDFNASIYHGDKIAIMGRNGCGKTTLLNALLGAYVPTEGRVIITPGVRVAMVPQILDQAVTLSGAERFQQALTMALAQDPDLLLLDEPTNHLDRRNKHALMRMLSRFTGTLLVVSHDTELLHDHMQHFWHIEKEKIHIFQGNYDDYQHEIMQQQSTLESTLLQLKRERKAMHQALMQEQIRAKHSRNQGKKHIKQRKWPTVVSTAKAARSEATSGHKRKQINTEKTRIIDKLSQLGFHEVIKPSFSLSSKVIVGQTLLSIADGEIGYEKPVLSNIQLQLLAGQRLAIMGDNATGKSTLFKAILGDSHMWRKGDWMIPADTMMDYLDQHYQLLTPDRTVIDTLSEVLPQTPYVALRQHLNQFLFRKNAEVETVVAHLSGGERVRLALAVIAAKTPAVLMLDEITNNVDRETREHMIQVLRVYPGAFMIISHDEDFLTQIGVTHRYQLREGFIEPIW